LAFQLFRGALFRILEEKTGTWGALAVSGLIFGGQGVVLDRHQLGFPQVGEGPA
jgi:hypothetical protein